ncbi:MAG TPA: biotin/lipoyl-containing protein [Anaerolineae bacterium]|nr:biotin/lipoyl-containing protein [Anaerolineae bacterium]
MTREFSLTLDGTTYKIAIDGNSILVNGQPFVVGFEEGQVLVDGTAYDVTLAENQVVVAGIAYELTVEGLEEKATGPRAATAPVAGEGAVTAIMPGKIIRVPVSEGDDVAEGDVVCILEAMKMENELKAPKTGTVQRLYAQPGQDVEMGTVLAEIN